MCGLADDTSLQDLEQIEKLDISNKHKVFHNYLFRKWITKCLNLKTLNLSYCEIYYLPREITELENLHTLNLEGNHLRSLPSEFINLSKICNINLSDNRFTCVPYEIRSMTHLKHLCIDNTVRVYMNTFSRMDSLECVSRRINSKVVLHEFYSIG
jgi:Leucine-rich repeat (LRR) protein